MDDYSSTNNLKTLLNNILTTKVNNKEILDFINFCFSKKVFDNQEQELLILEIYITLKKINAFIPLIDYSLDAIPEKIILKDFYCGKSLCDPQIEAKEKFSTGAVEINPKSTDSNASPQLEDIKKKIIEFYSPFSKTNNPNLVMPAPGELGSVIINNIKVVPDKIYSTEVLIDHEGNIVEFMHDPVERLDNDDYNEIYKGLVGQLFQFQEESK